MSKSVKEQAEDIIAFERSRGYASSIIAGSLYHAGLLNDERAQACVEACKAYRAYMIEREHVSRFREGAAVYDAGAAYDEPKRRTRDEIVAELVERWGRDRSRISPLLDELAASVKGGGKP